jgi:hypothetical protein
VVFWGPRWLLLGKKSAILRLQYRNAKSLTTMSVGKVVPGASPWSINGSQALQEPKMFDTAGRVGIITAANQIALDHNQTAGTRQVLEELGSIKQLVDPEKMAQEAKTAASKIETTLKQVESAAEVTAASAPLMAKLEAIQATLQAVQSRQHAIEGRQQVIESKVCACAVM